MTRWTLALALAAVGLALAGPALAEDADADTDRPRLRDLIDRFDTDGDGRLNATERAALREWAQDRRAQRTAEPVGTFQAGQTDLYRIADGLYETRTAAVVTLRDQKRGKDLPLRITWPHVPAGDKTAPFPLIVFCHGALGSKDGAEPLAAYWASHGYIVVRPTHGDSLSLLTPQERLKVLANPVAHLNSDAISTQWDDRPLDVKLILDSLDELEKKVPALAGRIDRERIGQSGHSYGAHTSMMLAGMKLRHPVTGETGSIDDPRPDCFVIISPQGPGQSITDESYAGITRPALFITGDHDGSPMRGQEKLAGAWRRTAYDKAAPGEKYLLWIKDAHHDFGGINSGGGRVRYPGSGEPNPDMVTLVKTTALAMFDAYLKDNAEAKKYLAEHDLSKATAGLGKLERR